MYSGLLECQHWLATLLHIEHVRCYAGYLADMIHWPFKTSIVKGTELNDLAVFMEDSEVRRDRAAPGGISDGLSSRATHSSQPFRRQHSDRLLRAALKLLAVIS